MVGLSAKSLRTDVGNFVCNQPFTVILGGILCLLYLYFFSYRALLEFELQIDSPYPSYFKVYWASGDQAYLEQNSQQMLITAYRQKYSMFLTNLSDVTRLRIDPLEYPGVATLKRFAISQAGYVPIDLDTEGELTRIKAINQIQSTTFSDKALVLTTAGKDGQLELTIEPVQVNIFPLIHLINILLILAAVFVLRHVLGFLFKDDLYIPCFLLVALILASTMASLTGPTVHPDEKAHLEAVNYYSEHTLPPAVGSDAARNSYSVYGFSRLYNLEIYYQIAGYFSRSISPLHLSSMLNARIFGLLLLLALVIASVRLQKFRIFVLPLLLSAQTWYLFSYTNSESFALFITTIMSYQAGYRDSLFNRLLREHEPRHLWATIFLFGLLFGVLLLLKTNFYFFNLFLGLYLLWRIAVGDFPDQRLLWTRLIVLALIGGSVYGLRVGLDFAVDGPNRQAKLEEMVELHAQPIYKPSTPLNQKHIYLYLKDRGFSLDRILVKERWGEKSFISAFGAYGYTQYFASTTFYDLVYIMGFAFLGLVLLGTLINGPPSAQALLVMVAICGAMLVGLLLWRSWTISFQPQGRYLAPVLPMLGVLYYHIRPYVYDKAVITFTVGLFLLGVYSFIFVGLYEVGKSTVSV